MSYGTHERETNLFLQSLAETMAKGHAIGRQFGLVQAVSIESIEMILFAFSFWYGCKLIREDGLDFADIFIAMQCVLFFAFGLANAMQYFEVLAGARAAAFRIYAVIDHKSSIEGLTGRGEQPASVAGKLQIDRVHFAYPSAPGKEVLAGLSFTVAKGQTVGLVGHSGCGKSTIVNLLMRFYDPTSGAISLDGRDLAAYNLEWLRAKIGLVAQQPPLLPGTIRDNVAVGKADATMEEIREACRVANAHDFIMAFPNQYDEDVGSLGSKLSGGQRQRIAIASVMISKPEILILDEATSALDNLSEARFQRVLDETKHTRSTIVIAHRLSTIRDADEIIVFDHGGVVERGTHDELASTKGLYHSMLNKEETDAGDDGEQGRAPGGGGGTLVDPDDFMMAADDGGGPGAAGAEPDAVGGGNSGASAAGKGRKGAKKKTTGAKKRWDTVDGKVAKVQKDTTEGGGSAEDADAGEDEGEQVQMYTSEEVKGATKWVGKLSAPTKCWFYLSLLSAACTGVAMPIAYVVLAKVMTVAMGTWETAAFGCLAPNGTAWAFHADQYECFGECRRGSCWGCSPSLQGVHSDGTRRLAPQHSNSSTGGYYLVPSADFVRGPCTYGCAEERIHPGDEGRSDKLFPYFIYICLAFAFFAYFKAYSQYMSGEALTYKIRELLYGVFLRRSMGWHDKHPTGELNECLSLDAAQARLITIDYYPPIVQSASMLLGGVTIGIFFCWRFSLVFMALSPIMIFFMGLESTVLLQGEKPDEESAAAVALELEKQQGVMIVQNVKVITSVGRAQDFLETYARRVEASKRFLYGRLLGLQITSFLAQFCIYGYIGFGLWWAMWLMREGYV